MEKVVTTLAVVTSGRDQNQINKYYVEPNLDDFNGVSVLYTPDTWGSKKKLSAKDWEEFISDKLEPMLIRECCKYCAITHVDLFKKLTKKIATHSIGTAIPYKSWFLLYMPLYTKIFYYPEETKEQISLVNKTLHNLATNNYIDPTKAFTFNGYYPKTVNAIKESLKLLLTKPALAIDIETYTLKHYDSGIASIAFSWDTKNGIAFRVDPDKNTRNEPVRDLLRWFFKEYTGTCVYHNMTFDAYILTYQLFMKDLDDYHGLIDGLDIMTKKYEDTKIITYLATNSCVGNKLSLKEQAVEFAGDWAVDDITDIDKISENDLLQYNLIDTLSTIYVYQKHWPTLVKDNQEEVYNTIFKPAIRDIIHMQLVGLPMDRNQLDKVKKELLLDYDKAIEELNNNSIVHEFIKILNKEWVEKRNSKLKTKKVTIEDAHEVFNPSSNIQVSKLLFEHINLPIIKTTLKNAPSTDSDTLRNLKNHTRNPDVENILNALIQIKEVAKILTSFIPAFELSQPHKDNRYYLYGNQNLGGVVSGRLSSSNPNLANLPSGSKFGKTIKSCFSAGSGYLFVGIDYWALTL